MINMSTGLAGATAVPVKGEEHQFPCKKAQFLMRLSAATFALQTILKNQSEKWLLKL